MRISRLFSRLLLVGCIVGAAIPCAFGQGGGGRPGGGGGPGGGGRGGFGGGFGGGGMASLLAIAEVQKELGLDAESIKEYEAVQKEMRDEMMASFGGGRGNAGGGGAPPDMTKMRENMAAMQVKMETKLTDILDPKQFDRLIGLYIQRDGTRTLSSKTISSKLEITDEQKTKIAEIEKAAAEEMGTMFGGGRGAGGGGGGGDMREKMEKMRKDNEEKITGVLTAAQKAKMEELKGAKFEFPAPPPRGGRGGPGNVQ